MGKKQALEGKAKKPITSSIDDLDSNILLQIFASLSVMDLVIRISGVCKSWRSLCSEPSLWKTVDLTMFKNYFKSLNSGMTNERGLIFFKVALNRGGQKLEKLVFDLSSDITDELLMYAAQRCKELKELVLPSSQFYTDQGLTRALEFGGSLESLSISLYCCVAPHNIFQVIAANCKNLTVLRLRSCVFDTETSAMVTKCMPGLKVLTLRCVEIEKEAAEILLDKLVNLEELYLSLSAIGRLTHFREPRFLPPLQDEAMIQKVLKLRGFHFCIGYCIPCITVTLGPSSLQALNIPGI